ncbi:MAG: aminotransferase class I/II-fold pyridoxal phosphate-dependent enzyme [Deltaproteobacteria bacterium]|nr:aminotransferase class I/II-fold pyridoxal phosphate-dependent enzyme [Deltaproteobacteria bacterium]
MNRCHGGNIWQVAKCYGLKPADIIDFSASINPLGLSPKAKAKIEDSLILAEVYPEPAGEGLKEELARFHGLPEDNILVGNGSTEFIYIIPQVFKPKRTLVIEPSFSEYRNALALVGCQVDSFVLNEEEGFTVDINNLLPVLENRYDLLYFSNPCNPTGGLLSRSEILEIARWCKRCGTMLVVDEAFMDFVEAPHFLATGDMGSIRVASGQWPVASIKREAVESDDIIILRSMTKFFAMAGLRVGYLFASKSIIRTMDGFRPPWSVNTMAILSGLESLRDEDYIRETIEWFKAEHRFLFDGLKVIPYLRPYSSAANFFLVRILHDSLLSRTLQEALLKKGILVRDCASFVGLGDNFFRVAVRKREENLLLLEGLSSLTVSHLTLR